MHPHESHTSAASQRAPIENSKGVSQFLADTRHAVLRGSVPSVGGGLVTVWGRLSKSTGWELSLKAPRDKRMEGVVGVGGWVRLMVVD